MKLHQFSIREILLVTALVATALWGTISQQTLDAAREESYRRGYAFGFCEFRMFDDQRARLFEYEKSRGLCWPMGQSTGNLWLQPGRQPLFTADRGDEPVWNELLWPAKLAPQDLPPGETVTFGEIGEMHRVHKNLHAIIDDQDRQIGEMIRYNANREAALMQYWHAHPPPPGMAGEEAFP